MRDLLERKVDELPENFRAKTMLRESLARELNLAERDLFEFGGPHCDQVVARVLARL